MDGWTLDTIDEPQQQPDIIDLIDAELARIAGGAPGYPCVLQLQAGDPSWAVRIGAAEVSVLCAPDTAYNLLQIVRAGADAGHPLDAPDGSAWAFLLLAARHLQRDLARFKGRHGPPPEDNGMIAMAKAEERLLREAGAVEVRPRVFVRMDR